MDIIPFSARKLTFGYKKSPPLLPAPEQPAPLVLAAPEHPQQRSVGRFFLRMLCIWCLLWRGFQLVSVIFFSDFPLDKKNLEFTRFSGIILSKTLSKNFVLRFRQGPAKFLLVGGPCRFGLYGLCKRGYLVFYIEHVFVFVLRRGVLSAGEYAPYRNGQNMV